METESSAKLSQGQKKKLRQKKKLEAEKQQQQQQDSPASLKPDATTSNPAAASVQAAAEPVDFTFEEEIAWCVGQLKLGQKRKNATADQIAESEAVIKKLQSAKRSLPSKRLLMRVIFGEYRTLMREEHAQQKAKEKAKQGKAKEKAQKEKSDTAAADLPESDSKADDVEA